ncbi:GT2 [Ectocarpus sp. CCAP 1310/34]|nr:GT2 [Ectocarpus sp. CCAP 1310/34]
MSSVTQPDSSALGGEKTLAAVDAETPPRRELLQELLPRPTATATDRDGRVGEEEVDGVLASPTGVADGGGGGGTADAGAVVSDSETAAADATPVDASLMPTQHLSVSWSEISLHLDDVDEGGRKKATTAKDLESNSPVRTLSSTTPSFRDVRGNSSSSKAFGSTRSAITSLEVSDLFEKIRNSTRGGYASGSGLFGGRGRRQRCPTSPSRPDGSRDAPFRSGLVSGNDKNSSGADNDDGFPAAEELDGDMDRGGLAGALRRHSGTFPTSSATFSPMVSAAARARREAEVDAEEGFVWATSLPAATAVVAGAADTGAAKVVAGADGQSLALPCPPSDEEKVIYHNTGRFGLVTCAMTSFVTLTWGIWLFTIATPAFYCYRDFVTPGSATCSVTCVVFQPDHRENDRTPGETPFFRTVVFSERLRPWGGHLGQGFQAEVHAEMLKTSEEKGYRPSVDVFLPVCKEPLRLLANTWKYVAAMDYPDFKVFLLDDGASEGVQALASTFGADFLQETVPYLGEDPTIGIVQTPQFFRHRKEQTWVEQGAGISQEFFYCMAQMNQDRFNAAVCVGSCGLYRRAALEPLGYASISPRTSFCPPVPPTAFPLSPSRAHPRVLSSSKCQLLFVAPLPIMLLVWVEADGVLWYHSGFVMPSLIFAGIVLPLWSKQHYGMSSHRIKIIQ